MQETPSPGSCIEEEAPPVSRIGAAPDQFRVFKPGNQLAHGRSRYLFLTGQFRQGKRPGMDDH